MLPGASRTICILAHASGVGSVLRIHRSCATYDNGSYRIWCIDDLHDLDRDLYEVRFFFNHTTWVFV